MAIIQTFSGPGQLIFNPGTASEVIITKEQQLEEAQVAVERLNFEHKTQNSAAPHNYIKTGINASCKVSVADVNNFNLLAYAFGVSLVQDATNPAKKKIVLRDDAGLEFLKVKVILKPYVGQSVSTDANTWITWPNACLLNEDEFSQNYGLETQRSFMISFRGLPDADGVKVIFGDETAVAA